MGQLPSLPGLTAGSTALAQAFNGQSGHHEVSEKASGDGSQSKVGSQQPPEPSQPDHPHVQVPGQTLSSAHQMAHWKP